MPAYLNQVVAFGEARQLAAAHGWREKSLIYLTRDPAELLVLEHTDEYPGAGIQVPAGGVERGERPDEAAVRELAEETGLANASEPVYLESRVWDRADAVSRVRHYFWMVAAPTTTPQRWTHSVTAGEEDTGMVFLLNFRSRQAPGLTPGYGWESALDRLHDIIGQAH